MFKLFYIKRYQTFQNKFERQKRSNAHVKRKVFESLNHKHFKPLLKIKNFLEIPFVVESLK